MSDWIRPSKKEVVRRLSLVPSTHTRIVKAKEEEESVTKWRSSHYTAIVSLTHRIYLIENLQDGNTSKHRTYCCFMRPYQQQTIAYLQIETSSKDVRIINTTPPSGIHDCEFGILKKKTWCRQHPSICQARKLGADVNTKAKS